MKISYVFALLILNLNLISQVSLVKDVKGSKILAFTIHQNTAGENQAIGKVLMMGQDSFKVKYAINTSYNDLSSFDLVTNGPFVESFSYNSISSGMSICEGVIENRKLSNRMDALSIVDSIGNLYIHDIHDVRMNNELYDLSNSFERYKFLSKSSKNKISAFQNHLLVNRNEITFYKESSNQSIAIRKLFALITDNFGNRKYALIYLPKVRLSLYDAAELAIKLMLDIEYTIDKLIDLDAGACDFLKVSKENKGKLLDLTTGRSNKYVNGRQNLLAFKNESFLH